MQAWPAGAGVRIVRIPVPDKSLWVEVATQAHIQLLRDHNRLAPSEHLQAKTLLSESGPWEGLIIDDFFSVSREKLPADATCWDALDSLSTRAVLCAKGVYKKFGLKGSDHKDVLGSVSFKAAGAFVDSSFPTVADGLCLVSAPAEKRLSLAYISLQAAQLPAITPEFSSALAGCWVTLLYRRCLMSCLDTFFRLGPAATWIFPPMKLFLSPGRPPDSPR